LYPLPASLRSTDSSAAFCRQLKTFLFDSVTAIGAFEALAKMRGINVIIIIINIVGRAN